MRYEDGFYNDISNAEYHKTEAFSKSGMGKILQSPKHFKMESEHKKCFDIGTATHTAILEPDLFEGTVFVLPDSCRPGSGTGMKARKEKFLNGVPDDGVVVNQDERDNVLFMRDAVLEHPFANELLTEPGVAELSCFYHDPEFNLDTKIRMDWLNTGRRAILDVKSCSSAVPWIFQANAYKLGYDLQYAHYSYTCEKVSGKSHRDFYFVAVESVAPYGVIVYKGDDDLYRSGMIKREKALNIYKECMESGKWPGYTQEVLDLSPPRYAELYAEDRPQLICDGGEPILV